ncbi:MAG: ROK family glucokinase [Dactylosporangium sp.]|nr:ROK family glucokinase [Dactylosporangium sp.]NNJ62920.1 ROK family glucokinase [Dactylosporangium sp.]
MTVRTLGVDVGGTKLAAGVVDDSGEVLTQIRKMTPAHDAAQARDRIIGVIKELRGLHEVTAVGIGAAGWIDATRSTIMFAPNISWRDEPLAREVSEAVGLPVLLENDGNTAAWAEFVFGAGQDSEDSMVLVTVGTGIGAGVIVNGRLLRGAHGVAGELGHTRAVAGGLRCRCGRSGCYEQYASGSALVRYARATATSDADRARGLLDLVGGNPEAITGPLVTQAARAGCPASIAAFEEAGQWLGPLLADIVQAFDPRALVLGGGVAEAGELLLGPARRAYHEALSHRGRMPVAQLRSARLGNRAGLIGAADLVRGL